ncbi:MAG: glutaredoxin family protein [Betaproteobacteria bacterium]
MPRIFVAIMALFIAVHAAAQQQLFRYVDNQGRVVYSDTAPPPDAKGVQKKKLGGNFIETSELPYALQVAQQRNPVTLYSGPCGPLCEQARALLNRRGVPYRDVDPSQPGEMQKMKLVTGDQAVPVLTIGSAITIKGFEEAKWQAALDQAGYPKTPTARITALKREADKSAAEKMSGEKIAAAKAAKADKADTEPGKAAGGEGKAEITDSKTGAAIPARK